MSAVQVATAVLAKAAVFDPRIQATRETIQAWAECFGDRVWIQESLTAVTLHYSKSNPFPIMPGDILEYCKAQPPYSSGNHARAFLMKWAEFPMSDAIAAQTGVQPPLRTDLDYLPWAERKPILVADLKKWVAENEDMLTGAVLSRRFDPPELTA